MKDQTTNYYVYILECADQTYYTGIAKDVQKRLCAHLLGKGAKYTRGRGPLILRYVEALDNRSEALKRERQIKKLTRIQKLQLIKGQEDDDVSPKKL